MSRKDAILNVRQILVKRRDVLRRALAGDLNLLKELRAQTSDDMAEVNSIQDEISSQLAEVESRELSRIEYALERMREGQFGICEGCGTNIPMARLNALPYATYCISCQREAEKCTFKKEKQMVTFKLVKHSIRPNVELVEIILNGDVVGVIYPNEDGIAVVSAHFSTKDVPKGFDGEVIEDNGEGSFPPIPSAKIIFKQRRYVIINGKIQYLE